MLKAIPERVKGKLTHSLLKEIEEKQEGGTIHLPPAKGGKQLTVNLGPVLSDTKLEPLSQKEALQLSSKIFLYRE